MEELNLLKKLGRVKAPPDFEQKVLEQLSFRRGKQVRVKHLRLSLAGAFGALAVIFIIINIFILPQRGPVEFTDIEKGISADFPIEKWMMQREIIPIIESVDYSGEVQNLRREPPTIYILEQVSERTDIRIKY